MSKHTMQHTHDTLVRNMKHTHTTETKTSLYKGVFLTLTLLILTLLIGVPNAFAVLTLNDIRFDPAIIAAGDEVDIVVQYQDKGTAFLEDRIGNPDYAFQVYVEGDDTLTENFVTILDAKGDQLYGTVYGNEKFNRIFRIKIAQNAPPANYEFKLVGQWYYKGVPESIEQFIRFTIPVKKEGITLDIAGIQTQPRQIRPGDTFATVSLTLENSGEKSAKAIDLAVVTPQGIVASYSDNNKVYIGQLGAGEQREVIFTINVDEALLHGVYNLDLMASYLDSDNNNYQKQLVLPLLIKPRPNIEIVNYTGVGAAGGHGELYVTVQNTGEQSAEAVDVRIVKQHTQPFTIDVRSDYVGELAPGETAIVKFDVEIDSDATQKDHMLQLIIRAKGDTDEGDDTIYTFNRRATFTVDGTKVPMTFYLGIVVGLIVLLVLIVKLVGRKK